MLFSLSWTLNGTGGNSENPIWDDIEKKLTLLKSGYGILTLDIHDNDIGSQMLQVRAELGNYLVMLGEIINDDYEVRTYYDEKMTKETICILGDYWSKNQITTDFSFIVQVVYEFFNTGNVQNHLLI
ncbi:DUF6911 family protein [Providencia sp. Me31A]|uniref:DUF6911 family protein n=1 Tax=Providencia sp. Me31A TaxID=3392637 RepID=UPI003D2B99D8